MVCALARERFQKQYFIFAKIFLAFYSQAPKTRWTNTKHKIVFQPANVIEHHSGKIFVMPTALILTCSFWHLRCVKYSIVQNWWRTKVHNRCVCTMLLVVEFINVRLLFEPAQQCHVNLEVSEISQSSQAQLDGIVNFLWKCDSLQPVNFSFWKNCSELHDKSRPRVSQDNITALAYSIE